MLPVKLKSHEVIGCSIGSDVCGVQRKGEGRGWKGRGGREGRGGEGRGGEWRGGEDRQKDR